MTGVQDGYAVRFFEGAGDFPVAFEVLAGTLPAKLEPGHIAYITTGKLLLILAGCFASTQLVCNLKRLV